MQNGYDKATAGLDETPSGRTRVVTLAPSQLAVSGSTVCCYCGVFCASRRYWAEHRRSHFQRDRRCSRPPVPFVLAYACPVSSCQRSATAKAFHRLAHLKQHVRHSHSDLLATRAGVQCRARKQPPPSSNPENEKERMVSRHGLDVAPYGQPPTDKRGSEQHKKHRKHTQDVPCQTEALPTSETIQNAIEKARLLRRATRGSAVCDSAAQTHAERLLTESKAAQTVTTAAATTITTAAEEVQLQGSVKRRKRRQAGLERHGASCQHQVSRSSSSSLSSKQLEAHSPSANASAPSTTLDSHTMGINDLGAGASCCTGDINTAQALCSHSDPSDSAFQSTSCQTELGKDFPLYSALLFGIDMSDSPSAASLHSDVALAEQVLRLQPSLTSAACQTDPILFSCAAAQTPDDWWL